MRLPAFVKTYLVFSKKERIAVIIILLLLVAVIFLPFLKQKSEPPNTLIQADSSWLVAAAEIQQNTPVNESFNNNDENTSFYQIDNTKNEYKVEAGTLFNFDPNTLNAEGFKKLGLTDKTIRTLRNYRNKGGRFRKPEDLRKIYGLRADEFERLFPYIQIAENNNESNVTDKNIPFQSSYSAEIKPKYQPKNIEVNSADTTTFKSLYGIGSKRAAHIVNFRNKLGGFYSIEQVGETYGVPDSTFQKIKPYLQIDANKVNKINVNAATYDALNNHPYISSKLAYLILKHRKENGSFSNINQIEILAQQTGDDFNKVSKYIIAE